MKAKNKRTSRETMCYLGPFFPSLAKICWILIITDQSQDTSFCCSKNMKTFIHWKIEITSALISIFEARSQNDTREHWYG